MKCLESLEKFIINVIKIKYPKSNINIHLYLFSNINNKLIVEYFKNYNIQFIEILKTSSQVLNLKTVINSINNKENSFIFILRTDMIYIKDIDLDRINKNKILFQWNFIKKINNVVITPDITFGFGGNIFNEFKDKFNKYPLNYNCNAQNDFEKIVFNCLHNLLTWSLKLFKIEKISYIYKLEKTNIQVTHGQVPGLLVMKV